MSKKVIIESKLKSDRITSLIEFLEANLPNVRGFKGCQQVTVYLNREEQTMIFVEEWLSIQAHQQYIAAITENGVLSQLASFLESPPKINYFDKLEL